jgi:hypothetical protein
MSHEHQRRDDSLSSDEVKGAMKEALKEWLDAKFAEVGVWTFRAFAAALLGAIVFFMLTMAGWHKGP